MHVVCLLVDAAELGEGVGTDLHMTGIAGSSIAHLTANSELPERVSIATFEVADMNIELLSRGHSLLQLLTDMTLGDWIGILDFFMPDPKLVPGKLPWA